jgi:hypothetical protein
MYHVSVGLAGQLAVRIVHQEAVAQVKAIRRGLDMIRYRKARRRFRKRAPPDKVRRAAEKGVAGQGKRRSALRDKIAILVAAAVLVPVVVFTLLSFYRSGEPDRPPPPPTMAGSAAGPKAAIVDQLSITQPNAAFADAATNLLEQAGYAVDYYPGEEVTVEFYRDLPTRGYKLIILRVHSARLRDERDALTDVVGLFTSEPYSQKRYVEEQKADRVRPSRIGYVSEGLSIYFGITPSFIKSSMKGKFDDTTVILMGCDGLRSHETADTFLQKGAKAYVAWDGLVSSSHTDAATERLLQHLLADGLPLQEAVAQTMADVGPDPQYGSMLLVYPSGG